MPVIPIPRYTMQDWIAGTDCCNTIALADNTQHRTLADGSFMVAQEISDYVHVVPPIEAFHECDIVRIRPYPNQDLYSPYTGMTGVITEILPAGHGEPIDQVVITWDVPLNLFEPSATWGLSRVEKITHSDRVFGATSSACEEQEVDPQERRQALAESAIVDFSVVTARWDAPLQEWERELLGTTESVERIPRVTTSSSPWAAGNFASTQENEYNANAHKPFTLTPQSEEDTQMNLAELTENIIDRFVARQGAIANVLLDTKSSKALGVDARAIKREVKKFAESLSWPERCRSGYLRAEKSESGIGIKLVHGDRFLERATTFENMLPAVVPLKIVLLTLKAALPIWVEIEADYTTGYIMCRTVRGEAFSNAIASYGMEALCIFGVRGVTSDRFARAMGRSNEFRQNAAQTVFESMKSIAKASLPKAKLQKSSGGNFDNFMSTLRSSRKSSEVIIDRFEIPEHGVVSSRNWGIEVETAGARGVNTPLGWESKGDGSLESAYGDSDDDGERYCDEDHNPQIYDGGRGRDRYIPNPDWTDSEECEACIANNESDDNDGYRDCREFVSPILHSFHSKGLATLVEEIMTQPQNDSAGIHVHVDVSDLTPKQIGSLVYGYQIIEPLIEASYQRETREYCKARRNGEVLSIIRQVKQAPTMRARDISTDTRYVALNVESIRAHGTVEFRAMGPVYDYEYLIRWAYVCRELVNVAKANISQSEWNAVDSFDTLAALFIRRGAESVDTQLSTITDSDIADMIRKNSFNVDESVYATIGGEI